MRQLSYGIGMILKHRCLCPLAIGQYINEHATTSASRDKNIPAGRKGETTHLIKTLL